MSKATDTIRFHALDGLTIVTLADSKRDACVPDSSPAHLEPLYVSGGAHGGPGNSNSAGPFPGNESSRFTTGW